MIDVLGVHHVKVPVTDLVRSRAWYETLLPLTPHLEFADESGTVQGVVYRPLGALTLCLREDPPRARGFRGYDPFAILVQGEQDLLELAGELDGRGIAHGPVRAATLGWMLEIPDPDGLSLRFYTHDRHDGLNRGAGSGRDVSEMSGTGLL